MLAARARGVGSAIGWFVGGVSAAKHLLGAPEGRRSGHNFSGLPEGRCTPRTGLDAQTALGDPLRGALWCLA
jgi:hypothetical protein